MKRARFKTKLSKRQKKKSILGILSVIVLSYVFVMLFAFAIGIFDDFTDPETYLLGFVMSFATLSMTLFPVLIIAFALGFQKGSAKRVKDDSSFIPRHNFDYYRDTLQGMDPSLVSILIDLDMYGKKDIAATLLRLKNNKMIDFDEKGGIAILNRDVQGLNNGERELFYLVDAGKIDDKRMLAQWKQNRFADAARSGYITGTAVDKNETVISVVTFVISLFIGLALWAVFLNMDKFMIRDFGGFLLMTAQLLVIDAFMFVPCYLLARRAAYLKRSDVLWERTSLGNQVAEQIAGLGRFIHDFSLMSEVDKEAVIVWDDYLVYALVLEENDRIVEDISKHYQFNLHRFDEWGLLRA